ncbi:MAG: beta-propeller domain-containing protein [Myxococcota bacterium]
MNFNGRSHFSTYSLTLATVLGVAAAGCSSSADDRRGEVTYRTALVQYQTCSALESDLKQQCLAELDANFEQGGYWGPVAEDAATDTSSGGTGGNEGRQEGVDYSGTNNQEEGVDEADFVKTDGYHVYNLNGNRLHIFAVPEFGELVPESEFTIEGHPRAMLLNSEAGKAVVFSNIYAWDLPEDHPLREIVGSNENDDWMWRVGELSKLTIIDVSDSSAPQLERELFLEANYQTARMVDGSVRVGAYSWMNIPGLYDWWWYWDGDEGSREQARDDARERIQALSLADMVPQIYERQPDGTLTTHSLSLNDCRSFYRPENSDGRGFTSILSLDLLSSGIHFDADHVLSNWPTIYSSREYMYIAEAAHDWWWFWWNEDHPDQLNLHMFDIQTPGESLYLGSGRVEGSLHNQFSLDEHEGYLRVAATTNRWGRWWEENPPEPENRVYVLDLLDGELSTVGEVTGIAEGETIFSARMIGDKGYMVTFRQVDPLFTLDLSDPYDPRVVGELKLPGFSTYIHPIADDMLLTIGVGGDDNGANWRTQISMFDVGDFANPSVFDQEDLVLDGEWGWSEAQYEHKAFQYFAPKKMLAIPLSSERYDENGWQWTSTLELLSVDTETGLSSYGSIDHSHLFNNNDDPETYWYYSDVRRSIFMGDFIYAISDRGITVHNLDNLDTAVVEQPLPGYNPYDYHWWW